MEIFIDVRHARSKMLVIPALYRTAARSSRKVDTPAILVF